ncbi:MAG: acyl-CoA dehydrogenase [Planctomycetes bacterium]|nr:acyl-CoA dehydrogenase [Planctomycetota bacterium]
MTMFAWLIRFLKARRLLPTISGTERAALEAGTVWIEADLFSGRPDFRRFMQEAYPALSEEERAFLDGPVEEVVNMVRPWDLLPSGELPESVWTFLRRHRFFGLMLPKDYEGHGFGSLGFSSIVGKLATHSMPLSSIVLIPNSIGPGELIAHYGTVEQKERWLRRLGRGEEIPAFALTEPTAGSDAASIVSSGELFRAADGSLAIRLDFDKRYITLGPIATLLGLAFRLRDPENFLGKGEDVGITCGLVPTNLPGVEIGQRHDPMGTAFPVGPVRGRGVVIPASNIFGGVEYAGCGWQMLMDALAGGRALSLPGTAATAIKAAARRVGAYAAIREQFGVAIGRMEGVQEPLSRIAGRAYLMDAVRVFTCGAVGRGQKPSVVSAMAKYQLTELARQSALDAMDVMGGKGICRGPRNPMGDGWMGAPIGITVEGANILTRTLIVFGQGSLRCHPYLAREVRALENGDPSELRRALFGHAFYFVRNSLRAAFLTLSRGLLASGAPFSRPVSRYVKKLKWASSLYAVLADIALGTSGPALKARGQMTGRFADALSWMFVATAVLRRFEAEGRPREDLPLVHWSLSTALAEIQRAFEGILANFRAPLVGWPLRVFGTLALRLSPLGSPPSDRLKSEVASLLLVPGETRDRLTYGTFLPRDPESHLAILEETFHLVHQAAPVMKKIHSARKAGTLSRGPLAAVLAPAVEKGVLSTEEADLLRRLERLRAEIYAVDEFGPEPSLENPTEEREELPVGGLA